MQANQSIDENDKSSKKSSKSKKSKEQKSKKKKPEKEFYSRGRQRGRKKRDQAEPKERSFSPLYENPAKEKIKLKTKLPALPTSPVADEEDRIDLSKMNKAF